MRNVIKAFAIAVVFLGCPAVADSSAPSASGSPADPVDPELCVSMPAPTGSHLSGAKECHKRSEWDQIHSTTGDAARRFLKQDDAERLSHAPGGGH